MIMKTKELKAVVRSQHDIIIQQAKRIRLLEDKVAEVRGKYFDLKYSDDVLLYPHPKN
jgi:hypothetical protein